MNNEVYEGICVWFDPKLGYGFIEWYKGSEKQEDMFLHFSDLVVEGFKTIKAEQRVRFSLGTNNKGNPKAVEVELI